MLACVWLCCSALRCVAVCCSVLPCDPVYCSLLRCVLQCVLTSQPAQSVQQMQARTELCCSVSRYVLQHVADCCSVFTCHNLHSPANADSRRAVLQCVAVCCGVLRCVAVCGGMLQSVYKSRPAQSFQPGQAREELPLPHFGILPLRRFPVRMRESVCMSVCV